MIHLILGSQGHGKTLLMVKEAYENFLKGKTIYSNVHLKFPYNVIDYQDIIDCKYNNAMVLLDEAHLILPARASMRKNSRLIVDNFLSMVRKKNLEVYGTTQTSRKIDVRFREETDYGYYSEKWAYNGINKFWYLVPHNDDLDPIIPIKIKLTVTRTMDMKQVTMNFDANPYFKMYDSKQVIKIKGLED